MGAPTEQSWPEPSDRVKELIRRAAEFASNAPEEWVTALQDATLTGIILSPIAADPTLAELVRNSDTAVMLHWAAHNLAHPGARVPPNIDSADALAVAATWSGGASTCTASTPIARASTPPGRCGWTSASSSPTIPPSCASCSP